MIPMRDGVKLFTVIILAKGTHNAPILLTRTPYNAPARATTLLVGLTRNRAQCRLIIFYVS
jgi:uncharacterized protein